MISHFSVFVGLETQFGKVLCQQPQLDHQPAIDSSPSPNACTPISFKSFSHMSISNTEYFSICRSGDGIW